MKGAKNEERFMKDRASAWNSAEAGGNEGAGRSLEESEGTKKREDD